MFIGTTKASMATIPVVLDTGRPVFYAEGILVLDFWVRVRLMVNAGAKVGCGFQSCAVKCLFINGDVADEQCI
ncbi:MAG TPA: hypothetical protein P5182_09860 [Myxococcota bacterium]|nr:hypothetical protein [Myxococcota bacterium]